MLAPAWSESLTIDLYEVTGFFPYAQKAIITLKCVVKLSFSFRSNVYLQDSACECLRHFELFLNHFADSLHTKYCEIQTEQSRMPHRVVMRLLCYYEIKYV